MFDQLVRELRTGVLLLLALFVGALAVVFVFTQLHVVLDADLATPLIVVGVAIVALITETIKHQRGQY
jgi:hypothetical protein